MSYMLLTQDSGMIIGPVAKLLGYLMEGIFFVIDKIGLPNIGIAIILFTILINLLMLPLTIKQQKFSKLNAKMSPEIQAIQKKYKGRNDQAAAMAMQQETQEVYAKYGVSPTGSCVQLLIQMPILFALYRVIAAMPAYVGKIKEAFFPLVDELIAEPGSAEFIQGFKNSSMYLKQFSNELFTSGNVEYVQNTYIDCLNKASTSEWLSISEKFPALSSDVSATLEHLDVYNSFLGLNIANSPSYIISESFKSGSIFLAVGALMIPLLAAFTQWVNTKLMPSAARSGNSGNEAADSMAQTMKTMNITMPIMSAVFCFTLPAGMGIYWIAGAVVRSIQQILINKHIDKMDINKMIEKNLEKNKDKLEKNKVKYEKLAEYANQKTKNSDKYSNEEKEELLRQAREKNVNAKAGSLAAKANMVKDFNERNNK